MQITEKILPQIFKSRDMDNLQTIYLESRKITKISLKNIVLENVIFLSLRDNYIKEIDFITSFRNLWYLDLRENLVTNN